MPRYPARMDQIYRMGLAVFVGSLLINAVAVAGGWHTLAVWGQGIGAFGMLWAGWTFLVWLRSWRWLVRALVVAGLLLWPVFPLGGWAATLMASAIMAAKENHCFHFWSGKYIPWVSLALGIVLALPAPGPVQAGLWIVLAWLWVPLLVGRFRLPLFVVE